jgi:hypothetical protein
MATLIDYFGNPIKRTYGNLDNFLQNVLKINEPQMKDYLFVRHYENTKYESNIIQIIKYGGSKKDGDIFVSRTNTDWYRISTREEANNFKLKELVPKTEEYGETAIKQGEDNSIKKTEPKIEDNRDSSSSRSNSTKSPVSTVRRKSSNSGNKKSRRK